MADHGLQGADGQLGRVLGKERLNGGGFDPIVRLCSGAVSAKIVDVLWLEARISERPPHCHLHTDPFRVGHRGMMGVAGKPVANHLGIDSGASCSRRLQRLQDQYSGAFAGQNALPIFVEGAASIRRHRKHATEAGERHDGERIGPTREREVDATALDPIPGNRDSVVSCSARRGNHQIRAPQPEMIRDRRSDPVAGILRETASRPLVIAGSAAGPMHLFQDGDLTTRRSDHQAGFPRRSVQSRVLDGQLRRSRRQNRCRSRISRKTGWNQVFDLAGPVDLVHGRIEATDLIGTVDARGDGFPESVAPDSYRGDRPQAGDDGAPGHGVALRTPS